jgi:hypothetical protein
MNLSISIPCPEYMLYAETFHWVAGPWMTCSSPCDGGVRYRDVACFGNLDDNTIKHYPVDDASCSADEMVLRTIQFDFFVP